MGVGVIAGIGRVPVSANSILSFQLLLNGYFGPLSIGTAVQARTTSLHSRNDVYNTVALMERHGVQWVVPVLAVGASSHTRRPRSGANQTRPKGDGRRVTTQQVSDTVRKERIRIEGDGTSGNMFGPADNVGDLALPEH